jgi:homogentisate 1,2-dioxygenase
MGYEGFSGNESILYHLQSPCRVAEVGEFTPIELREWVPDAHVHRLTNTAPLPPGGDPVFGRRVLMFNADVQLAVSKPTEELDAFYRNGEGDEVLFVHEGSGELESVFGRLPFGAHDYVVIPRGTTYRVRLDEGPHTWLTFFTPGEIETPNRYRNRYGQLLEHAPFSQRDFHPPAALETHREPGEHELIVRVRGGYQRFTLDYHPLDVVGWDGYVYPYTFNIHDFEPKSGRLHQPPPAHQTFQGPNFVICSFCPRQLDWDPLAVPLPYHHSNLQSEEVIYYVEGRFGSRRGVEVGSLTLHPSGLPHGPQPGLVEKALGATRTEELAVMCDTFRPLRLTELARELDDPAYALSWHSPVEAAAT